MGGGGGPAEAVPLGSGDDTTANGATEPRRCLRLWRCCAAVIGSFQTIIVGLLVVALVLLALQVQYVAYELGATQAQVAGLQESLHNQTQGQIQQLTDRVEQEHSLTLYQMAGTFSMLTCLITMFHMSTHLRNFRAPLIQRKIVAILWMTPIYSVTSFLSLIFPTAHGYLAVIREFYEAYVIFTFLSFLIAVLGRGDRRAAVEALARDADHLKPPARWLRAWYHPPPETGAAAKANAVITECTILCMQYVFVRPITAVVSFVSVLLQQAIVANRDSARDDDAIAPAHSSWDYFKSPSFYCDMVVNVSVIFAFRGLLKFYHAVDQQLQWCQPLQKFLAIKAVVFVMFWQGLLISILVQLQAADDRSDLDAELQAAQIQNFLICLEMLFFSIAHWCVFPVEEWEPDYRPKAYGKPGMAIQDFVQDVGYIISSRSDARRYRKQARPVASDSSERPTSPTSTELELNEDDTPPGSEYVDVARPDALAPIDDHDLI